MKRTSGTISMGIRAPIVKKGDNLKEIVVQSLIDAIDSNNIELNEKDVLGITESILARAQGNYATVDDIGNDVASKFPDTIGLIFPILSRNRFSVILKGIIASGRKVVLQLSYPSDEVGNVLMDINKMYDLNINPWTDQFSYEEYKDSFGDSVKHPFTGMDYAKLYKDIGGDNLEIIFSNNPKTILNHTKDVLVANIHDRERTKKILKDNDANIVFGLDEILNRPVGESGFNPDYGLLGSNQATEDSVKLFPRNCQNFVEEVKKIIYERTGTMIEVMIYGDGAFKDPIGGIWELADPVVSPGYTSGLSGTPNELKMKYIVDTELKNLSKEDATIKLMEKIKKKDLDGINEDSLGTTPRRITDLLGSLCDLTSGSGDKGTPIVLIQGYFSNYASE